MIDLEWVKDYIDIDDQDLKELAVKITKAGINIEKVITNHIDNLVIGEVTRCEEHPDSDHLHVCQVDVGGRSVQIVCGAPNVREGLKVIVALPGAILPGDFEIKKSKIRGVESNGMLCALYELGLEEKTEETYSKGIYEVSSDAINGADAMKCLNLDDTLYELDVHKHRNNDCYYHIGFAYEIAAILNRKVTLPDDSFKEINDSIKNHFNYIIYKKMNIIFVNYERNGDFMQNEFYIREGKIVEKSEIEKEIELIRTIIKTREELKAANINFEYAKEDLVDYYTYQIKANQAKLSYLIKVAKSKGIEVDMINDIKFSLLEEGEEAG